MARSHSTRARLVSPLVRLGAEHLESREVPTFSLVGSFQTYPESIPLGLTAGDFNNDGKVDVFTGNDQALTGSFLAGKGDGTLAASQPIDTEEVVGLSADSADFNGDGKRDLVLGDYRGGAVVFLGKGDGTFQLPGTRYSTGEIPYDVHVADFNSDGKPDFVVNSYASVAVFIGKGDGTFQAKNYPLATGQYYTKGIGIGDLNGDHKLDLVVTSAPTVPMNDKMNVLLGNGDGTFAAAQTYTAGSGLSIVLGDFNGDGKLDAAVGSDSTNQVGILLGDGTGGFGPPQYFTGAMDSGTLAAADVNYDGKLDLVQGGNLQENKQFAVILGNGDGTLQTPTLYTSGGGRPQAVVLADMDGDGALDIVVANADGNNVTVFHNNDKSSGAPGPSGFAVSAPAGTVTAGTPFDVTVTAKTSGGQTATGYTGTVHIASSDGQATLPADYTFTAADQGVHIFSVTLKTDGSQSISVADTVTTTVKGSATVTVTPASAASIAVVSGGGQSETVNTAFAGPLVARILDPYGNAVPGVTVTFVDPAAGASATFTGGATPTTDVAGKVSLAVTANKTAGGYSVSASVAGVATPASFALTNTPGAPASIVTFSGNGQSASVNTDFANPLVAIVADAFGNPIAGTIVTFAGPGTGAGVTFTGGAMPATDSAGKVSVAVTANMSAGSFNVIGAVAGVTSPASFALKNNPSVPETLITVSGDGQSATVNNAFANPLVVRVVDAFGNPVPGANVSFTGPGSGPGVTFTSGSILTTDAAGQVSEDLTANTVTGGYTVTAKVMGVGSLASFSLTNTAGAAANIAVLLGDDQAAKVNQPFPVPLAVKVTDAFGNAVPSRQVTFSSSVTGPRALFPGGSTTTTGTDGMASVSISANDRSGRYSISASVSGVAASALFDETNVGPPPGLIGYQDFAVGGFASATLYRPDATIRFSVRPFAGFLGEVRTAAGDFNGDGVADLVVGTGPGAATHVFILDGTDQHVLFSIAPFEASFTGGVFVAAGDLNGDGKADLAISPDEGGGPRVRIFSGNGFTQIADFFGIDDPNFRGGARAAFGDVNGDGKADLLVAAGFGGGPRVAVFNGSTLGPTGGPKLFGDFFAFEQTLRNGIFVAAGDLNGDGFADIIAGGGPGGGPRVLALSGKDLLQGNAVQLANFFAGDVNSRGGIRVSVKNLDGDAKADLVVGAGDNAGSTITGYLGTNILPNGTPPDQFSFDAFPGYGGGVFVG